MSVILNKTGEYVKHLLESELPKEYTYHNLNHTLEVVETSRQISLFSKLNDKETEILLIAAWFHDTGLVKVYHGHEDYSARFSEIFLTGLSFPQEQIEMVKNTILATKMPHKPNNLLEEILSDADIGHMGKDNFDERSLALRTEWESVYNRKYQELEWLKINIKFMEDNSFYTDYCKKYMENIRLRNLNEYLRRLNDISKKV